MKILQITHTFPPAIGGCEAVSYNLSKELIKRGHEVQVFTTDILDPFHRIDKSFEQMDSIIIRRFHAVKLRPLGRDVGQIPFSMLPTLITKNNPNIIHIHTYRYIFKLAYTFLASN